ncbi:MAG: 1-acyl-sn-glycerol-3-phosphate acyltransferase [Clostridia bacterium]|nr:1-acyl-sn-glycerol-3-phosphate acyltransferase [Clostridia bacterium]
MFYKIMKAVITAISYIIMPVRVYGKERLAREGGYILACNHLTMLDIPALVIANERCIRFMAKAVLYKNGIIKWIFDKMGAFPVDTENVDFKAVRNALKVIKSKEVLGIFPQGTRMKGRPVVKREDLLSGAAFVALQTGADIIPCVFEGDPKLFRVCRLHIGDPISLAEYKGVKKDRKALEEVSDKIYKGMSDAMPQRIKDKYQA